MTLALTMIVKNEEQTLPRLAASIRDQIDYYVIVDTGSTDATEKVAWESFTGLDGQFVRIPWTGFGPARNVSLELAEPHADWLIWMDADEVLEGRIDVNSAHDWIECEEYTEGLRWWKPRIFRSQRGFHWTGRAHEYLSSALAPAPGRNGSFRVRHYGDGGSRGDKYAREVALLLEDWHEYHDGRSAFYLGRSFYDRNFFDEAVPWFRRRTGMGGWDEEIYLAFFGLGQSLLKLGAAEEGCGHLWRAWAIKPGRGEALVALAEHYRCTAQWEAAYLAAYTAWDRGNASEGLFLDSTMEWRILYELSVAAWHTDHKNLGRRVQHQLLAMELPEPYRTSVEQNEVYYQ